jgi:nucleoid-associated protein YgaU
MSKHTAPRYARTRRVLTGGAVAAGATAVGLGVIATPAEAATHDWSGVAQCESGGNWSINTGNGYSGGLQFSPSTWAAYGGTAYAPSAGQASASQQIAVAEKVLAGQGIGAWPVCGKRLTGGSTSVAAAAPASTRTTTTLPKSATPNSTTRSTSVTPKTTAPKTATPRTTAPTATAPTATAPKATTPRTTAPTTTTKSAASKTTTSAPKRSTTTAAAPVAAVAASNPAGTYTVQPGDTLAKIAEAHDLPGGWRELWAANRQYINDPDLIFVGQTLAL